jgi:hypothetical protein
VPNMCSKCKRYISVSGKQWNDYFKKWNELLFHTGLTEKTLGCERTVQADQGFGGSLCICNSLLDAAQCGWEPVTHLSISSMQSSIYKFNLTIFRKDMPLSAYLLQTSPSPQLGCLPETQYACLQLCTPSILYLLSPCYFTAFKLYLLL